MGCNRTADSECRRDERPGRTVILDAFYIDRTEVTVDAYAECVRAGACSKPRPRKVCKYRSTWQTPGRGRHPVNGVSWYQARDYCRWAGKRLPSEAEWEKAARGGDGRKFPWGDRGAGCGYVVMDDGGDGCGRDSPAPVCSRPGGLSPHGLCDMAGNVMEWVADRYARDYYRTARGRNPPGPVSGPKRVLRGSDYDSPKPRDLRTSRRAKADPEKVSSEIGFRCASSPPGQRQEGQQQQPHAGAGGGG
jgi:formylglycine-generating enzyme required for sulfatase activity